MALRLLCFPPSSLFEPFFILVFTACGVPRPEISYYISEKYTYLRLLGDRKDHHHLAARCGHFLVNTSAIISPVFFFAPSLTSISCGLWVLNYYTLLIWLPLFHLFSFFHKFIHISYLLFSSFPILLWIYLSPSTYMDCSPFE